ncbi:MAG: hypothetical protein RLZZ618_3303 [Pseudomonadota bacterium]|jgi:hypothetical protein
MAKWKWWVAIAVLAIIGAVLKDKASQKNLKNAEAGYKASCMKAVTAQSSMLSSEADKVCECSAKASIAKFGVDGIKRMAEKPVEADLRAMMGLMTECMDKHMK